MVWSRCRARAISVMLPGPRRLLFFVFFFFNDTATTEIYTLSLHDALPISLSAWVDEWMGEVHRLTGVSPILYCSGRSEEHTSELQSRLHLVCRLLLEKKKRERGVQRQLIPALS